MFRKVILLIAAILLILVGASRILLPIFGAKVQGVVYDVERYFANKDSSYDYVYEIKYKFSTLNGENITGSYIQENVLMFKSPPSPGTISNIYYFSLFPKINISENQSSILASGLLGIFVGIFMLYAGIKIKPSH